MGYENQQIGWSLSAKLLQEILKSLDRLASVVYRASSTINYTEYSLLLNQSGIGEPSATTLTNSTGATFTYSYVTTGVYTLTSSLPIFITNKLFAPNLVLDTISISGQPGLLLIQRISDTELQLSTFADAFGSLSDDLLLNQPLTIKIYN